MLTAAVAACVGLAMVDVVDVVDVVGMVVVVDANVLRTRGFMDGRPWTGGGGAVLGAMVMEAVVALTVFS